MSNATATLGPIGVIRSSIPDDPCELKRLLGDHEALRIISCRIGSDFSGVRVNPAAVRQIIYELTDASLQESNGSDDHGNSYLTKKRRKKRTRPNHRPATHRRSVRCDFRH